MEGITEGLWSRDLLKAELTLRSDQAAQSHFEHLPGWRDHNLYALVLVLTTLVVNSSSPKGQSEFPLPQLVYIASFPLTEHLQEQSDSIFYISPNLEHFKDSS